MQPEAQAGREDSSGAAVQGSAGSNNVNQAASLLMSTQLEESFVLLDSRARRPAPGTGASSRKPHRMEFNQHDLLRHHGLP